MLLSDSIRQVKGIGEKTEKCLNKLNIKTVKDLLYHLPVCYKDFRDINYIADTAPGEYGFFCVTVTSEAKTVRLRGSLTKTNFFVYDDSGAANVVIFNQIHIRRYVKEGNTLYIYGKLMRSRNGSFEIVSPQIYFNKPGELLPVYPLTAGITQAALRKYISCALKEAEITEVYSKEFMIENGLLPLKKSLELLHEPKNLDFHKSARERLVFDEFLLYNCMLFENDRCDISNKNSFCISEKNYLNDFIRMLDFEPTGAQKKVMREILQDMASPKYMNRLVQGDVGCGKTVVAFFAMYLAYKNGLQSVLMAPTEILACQHYNAAKKYFDERYILLLTGAASAKEKSEAQARIKNGDVKVIIGTHALLYGDIEYNNLALVITDEQHKFGVKQRAKLAGGNDVHTLIMSATPIPRSLTLVLYGKSDISVIDELPPGRQKIKSYIVRKNKLRDMLAFFEKHIKEGRQVYIVCPLVDENELFSSHSAKKVYAGMKKYFPGLSVGLLHGQMKNAEKDKVMNSFAKGEIDMLVSTTVIEVGVDVPNATIMCVLDAEHFGLAQLHQLRGRVGRGAEESFCFFVSDNVNAKERLNILAESSDGFYIAQKDMELRGSGDMLGTRQHGESSFLIADFINDLPILEKTKHIIENLSSDINKSEEYQRIVSITKEKFKEEFSDIVLN